MGIRDIWTVFAPAQQTRTLTEIAIREGFEPTRHPERCLRVAIDSSIWMNQAQTAVNYKRGVGTQAGENPALRILFYRLCRLLALSIDPVFVFDGLERPAVKRGVLVKSSKPHHLTSGFIAFIEAFGFHWYTAPAEAEADLAELSRKHIVDAVITDDSDALVFGALSVIRMPNVRDAGDLVTIYTSQALQDNSRIALSREGLFFMAILCGGDYDKTGLAGCGTRTALILSRTEFAKSLFVASSTLSSREQLQEFLVDWRSRFRDFLTNDPQGQMGQKHPSIAKHVNNNFPSIDILLLYARPLTSWTADQVPDSSYWNLTQPDLAKIANLAEKYFLWCSGDGSIVNRFKENVWPGVAIRFLLSLPSVEMQLASYARNEPSPGGCFTNANILRIQRAKTGPGGPATHANVAGYTVEVTTTTLLRATAYSLETSLQPAIINSNITKALIWIPDAILSATLPAMVQEFWAKRKLPKPGRPDYQPILPPLINMAELLMVDPTSAPVSPSAIAGPSTLASSSGDRLSEPIILSDLEDNETASTSTPSQEFISSIHERKGGKVKFLGYIDLC